MDGHHTPPGWEALVRSAAPLWAAEAEVAETYFSSAGRDRDSDRRWIERQCYKELVDGIEPRLRALGDGLDGLADSHRREEALVDAEELVEEYRHLDAFLEAHRAVAGDGGPPLDAAALRRQGGWPENDRLVRARARHRRDHGRLGSLAQAATEGGCCTLYAAGMAIPVRSAGDEAIVAACRAVYDDEVRHMRLGGGALTGEELSAAEWERLTDLVAEQLRLRIDMRNAQLGRPLAPERIDQLRAGAAPVRADILERIGLDPDQVARVATSST